MTFKPTRILFLFGLAIFSAAVMASNPVVKLFTNMGSIELELYPHKAPVTVKNFLGYVNSGFYNGTIFHRVIPGFMIQGGGFKPGMKEKPTGRPIRNEADNGQKNLTGTVAMARTSDPHSATAQFFINVADNHFLDHTADTPSGWGYAVFGRVLKGMDVVRKISQVPTSYVGSYQNVPVKDVVIERAELIKPAGK
jgi:cyclophilin family peptidyl-prolyl cis-trans isomerase